MNSSVYFISLALVLMLGFGCSETPGGDGDDAASSMDVILGEDGAGSRSPTLDVSADHGAGSPSPTLDVSAPETGSDDAVEDGEDTSWGVDLPDVPDGGPTASDAAGFPSEGWTSLPSFPGLGRRHALSFVLGSKIFVGGGRHFDPTSGWTELTDLWVYDAPDATWTALGDLPASAQSGHVGWLSSRASAVVMGDSVKVQRLGQTWAYDSKADLWSVSASFPGETEVGPIAFTDGVHLYGGLGGHTEMQMVGGYNLSVLIHDLKVYRLDSASMTWSFYKSFPELKSAVFSVPLVSKGATAFVLKGNSSQGWPVYIMDHETLELSAQTNLPFKGDDHPACGVEVGGQLVIVGVDTHETDLEPATHEELVWGLDEDTNQWGALFEGPLVTLKGDLQGAVCAGIGDVLYTGLGMTSPQAPPVAPEGTGVSHLAAGHLLSMAAFNGDQLSSWGFRSQSPFTPLTVDGGLVRDIDASDLVAAFVDGQGQMHAVGSCVSGGDTLPPPLLEGDLQQVEVACYGSLGLTVSGELVGAKSHGEFENLGLPEQAQINGLVEISLGGAGNYGLVLDAVGSVYTVGTPWGLESLPPEVSQGITSIAAGYSHALALTSAGEVIAWGSDAYGATSVPPELPSPTVAIDAGEDLSAAVSADGVLTCWGWLCESYIQVPDAIQGHVKRARLGAEHIVVELDDGSLRDLGNVRGKGESAGFFARGL